MHAGAECEDRTERASLLDLGIAGRTASRLGGVEIVDSFAGLEQLREEWTDLRRRAAVSSPFQSPEWLLSWWPFQGSGELFTVCVRQSGRLIGLAPMFILRWNERRQVTFIGNGVSDQLGFIVDRACARETAAAILEAIAGHRDRWDLCDLQDLPPESVLGRVTPPQSLQYARRDQYVCCSVPLPESADEFAAGLPHGLRRNLRRYRQKLEQCGRVMFETADDGNVQEHIDALMCLHRERWRAKRHDDGMLAAGNIERFHRAAASALHRADVARFHALRLDGRIVASVYAMLEKERAFSYLGGFDPALEAFSPGSLILEYAMRRSIEEGAREFDFLRGEEAYKLTWGAQRRSSWRLLLWHEDDHRPI
jgi:CelD/BcsL family acetyltransferase involved in cellulose biosynthesis